MVLIGRKNNEFRRNQATFTSSVRCMSRLLILLGSFWVLACIIFLYSNRGSVAIPPSSNNLLPSGHVRVSEDNNKLVKKLIKVPDINVIASSEKEEIDSRYFCKNIKFDARRPTHGCEVNPQAHMVFCNFENLKVDVSKIHSDPGGEPLTSVMGRSDDKEIPKYEEGAFVTDKRRKINVPSKYLKDMFYQKDVVDSFRKVKKENFTCTETWKGTTMFITRYEYANLFHTLTDWFNTFLVIPPESSDIQIVFLDAHAEGDLDSVWSDVFGKYTYVKHLPEGGVCFDKAILVPPGYVSPLNFLERTRGNCVHHGLAKEFVNLFLRSYNLEDVKPVKGKITIIDRQPYIAHPRSQGGKPSRMLENLNQLEEGLREIPGVTSIKIVRLETMSFRDQLELMRQSHIVIGVHGAGLSHVMFMDVSSILIEYRISAGYFEELSHWVDVPYTDIYIDVNTTTLDPHIIFMTKSVVNKTLSR